MPGESRIGLPGRAGPAGCVVLAVSRQRPSRGSELVASVQVMSASPLVLRCWVCLGLRPERWTLSRVTGDGMGFGAGPGLGGWGQLTPCQENQYHTIPMNFVLFLKKLFRINMNFFQHSPWGMNEI